MLSVLIQAEADPVVSRASKGLSGKTAPDGLPASRASLRSVGVLLSASPNGGLPTSDDIRSEFDLIIIDAPPLPEHPEVASLSAHADLVILVVRDSAGNTAAIRNARASLAKFGGAAIGIVVNQVSPRMAAA
jgi:Mrp family chromosome partitioning ATPase